MIRKDRVTLSYNYEETKAQKEEGAPGLHLKYTTGHGRDESGPWIPKGCLQQKKLDWVGRESVVTWLPLAMGPQASFLPGVCLLICKMGIIPMSWIVLKIN